MRPAVCIFWFRRDLRLEDNAGLYHALNSGNPVLPLFIFDRNILDLLENKTDRRVEFIYETLITLHKQLNEWGSTLEVRYGRPDGVFHQLLAEYTITGVYTNTDYEPYATERDGEIKKLLAAGDIPFYSYKDQVIFEKNEVQKDDGSPYTIFTPYSRKWKALVNDLSLSSWPIKKYCNRFLPHPGGPIPSLASMGFKKAGEPFPSAVIRTDLLKKYAQQRDYPGIHGTSHLGVHLRFGTVSIRALARKASEASDTFLNELIWREFYQMILWQFPQVGKGKAFKPAYDHIQLRNNENEFEKWCAGQTGYPLVDAGMRELNATGFMHNRVRMVVASFLAKHLLIDWRWGEAWFAEKLLDFDLAANNGGWQWAAGSGCDAAPYFRVFNPTLQARKFDPDLRYIHHWVPEWAEHSYPRPIVEHEMARKRALEVYAKAVKER
ncbi:deoxyribodipyrimidine photo-lyase [Puia sp.]|uniref:cryptochrome/photolyase family protein n=1 Tax=Puia sp. TaxID=2045100 RepID=UPI002F40AFC1